MSQRTERVDELLRQEIGAILAREVADPRIGFATVTDVETTRDLAHAKVWVSVIGDAAERRIHIFTQEDRRWCGDDTGGLGRHENIRMAGRSP